MAKAPRDPRLLQVAWCRPRERIEEGKRLRLGLRLPHHERAEPVETTVRTADLIARIRREAGEISLRAGRQGRQIDKWRHRLVQQVNRADLLCRRQMRRIHPGQPQPPAPWSATAPGWSDRGCEHRAQAGRQQIGSITRQQHTVVLDIDGIQHRIATLVEP